MRVRGGLPRLTAVLLLPLAGCSMLSMWEGDPIHVLEARRLVMCNSDGPQARLTLLADREAVRAWQRGRNVELIGVDPLPSDGPYVLVEMGVRLSAGYGIAVSRQAERVEGTVRLNASLITPAPNQAQTQMLTSPCVLVALPPGRYEAAELRDPSGTLLARADATAPVQ